MNYEKYGEVIIPPEADLKLPTNNNSRYFYNNKIKELVLDVVFNTNSGNKPREFKLQLADPLIIDVEHDIFLDTVVTYNLKSSKLPQNMAFLLKIDQFNIQTKSATNIIKSGTNHNEITNRINNSIMIPNEKSHETIETVIVKTDTTVNPTNPSIEINSNSFANSSIMVNHYNGYTLLFHKEAGQTVITTITHSADHAQTGHYTLTVDGFKQIHSDEDVEVELTAGDTLELFKQYNNHSTIHKGRKHNYVGTITPSKLANITGSVSDMGSLNLSSNTSDGDLGNITYGNPFHDADVNGLNIINQERMIVEFKLVPRQ